MATKSTMRTSVRSYIGEATASFWTNDEIDVYLDDSIKETQDEAPLGALVRMLTEKTGLGSSASRIQLLTTVFKIIELKVKEPDYTGDYTEPWEEVTQTELDEIKDDEGDLDLDETDTRVYAVERSSTADHYDLVCYPDVNAEAYRYLYIPEAATTGTMTLPSTPNLLEIVVLKAASKAMTKKSRDLPSSEKFEKMAEVKMAKIKEKYDDTILAR